MRRCDNCKNSRCVVSMTPDLPDLWFCMERTGMAVLHPVLRALTCRAYESRYRLQRRAGDGKGQDQARKDQGA